MKQQKKIRLSICIPTMNRGAFIGATLESIVSQATEEVEIVIVDGGSVDNTQQVVGNFQLRFPRLLYVRASYQKVASDCAAPSAGGFDRDCNRAVEVAQGEYCWLFTDDDLLKPGAIQTVLEAIEHDYGLVIVNSEVRNADMSRVMEPRRLRMNANRVYETTENQLLFADLANYMSFIGCLVIKKQLWSAREREKYFGTGFIHVGVVFQRPIPEDVLVIAEPLISIRFGNALYMNTGRYFEIWMFLWPQLIWSFPHYADWVKHHVCPKEPWRHVKRLLIHRAKGAFTLKEYSDWLEPRLGSEGFRLAARLLAQIPGYLINFLGCAYFWTMSRGSRLDFVELVKSPFYFWKPVQRVLGRSK